MMKNIQITVEVYNSFLKVGGRAPRIYIGYENCYLYRWHLAGKVKLQREKKRGYSL